MPQFRSFEFDSVRRQLLCAGEAVHLTPKAFGLLALLLEAAPRVVPKSELHQGLWPNGVVSDATLAGLVKELRRALAGHEPHSSFIRTVHRVGYAFDAPVIASGKRGWPNAARWLASKDRALPLAEGENLIGRDPLSQVWLDYSTVSRHHARIVVGPGGTLLEDLGSKNGTSVDGVELAGPTTLRDSSRVGFGQVFVTYREARAGMPTVTQVGQVSGALSEH
ncbi:MAG: winged helix-turn-helix domain-containing protein [Gammaproteobacteria bacterium]